MKDNLVFVLFYSCSPLKGEDIENSLFTNEKEEFKFFLFNNKNLHFSKNVIRNELLEKKFNQVKSTFVFNANSITMTKKLVSLDREKFEKEVDSEYEDYLKKINYRINCIFQSFTIFYEIYSDKSLIFIIPEEIKHQFLDYLNNENFLVKKVKEDSQYIKKYDIFYWLRYYSREDSEHLEVCELNKGTITNIIGINKDLEKVK